MVCTTLLSRRPREVLASCRWNRVHKPQALNALPHSSAFGQVCARLYVFAGGPLRRQRGNARLHLHPEFHQVLKSIAVPSGRRPAISSMLLTNVPAWCARGNPGSPIFYVPRAACRAHAKFGAKIVFIGERVARRKLAGYKRARMVSASWLASVTAVPPDGLPGAALPGPG